MRLGVNIDHVATIRQLRGTPYPDVVAAAREALAGGADSITVHLREDRRHIQDHDVRALAAISGLHLNLEMAMTDEMVRIARQRRPQDCCIVPERRREVTTEGGLDLARGRRRLALGIERLAGAGIAVSLFVDPDEEMPARVIDLGARIIEIHTGAYAEARTARTRRLELRRVERAAERAAAAGLQVHAGHGLHYGNVGDIARIAPIEELNIGHAIVAEALGCGLRSAVRRMRDLLDGARRA